MAEDIKEPDENLVTDNIHDIISDEQLDIGVDKFEDNDDKKIGFIRKTIDFVKGNRKVPYDDIEEDDTPVESEKGTEEAEKEVEGTRVDGLEETPEGDAGDTDGDAELTIDSVDARLVTAARRRGWDNAKILKYAESDISVLDDVANLMDRIDTHQDVAPVEKTKETTPEKKPEGIKKVSFTDDQKANLESKYGEGIIDEVLQPILDANNLLVDKVNALSEKDKAVETDAVNREVRERADTFMEVLDASAKDYPELGKWENVPLTPNGQFDMKNPIVKVRAEIYDIFESFVALGQTAKVAVDNAMLWYGAKSKSNNAETKIIEKLNSRKKKFINRPGQRKVAKKFESEDDRKRSVIRDAMGKAGIQTD